MSKTQPVEKDPVPEQTGVLLSDQILYYVNAFKLIEPFNSANLKPASYDFTIGELYVKGGKEYHLDDQNRNLVIEPHEAVVVSTKESLNMPRFLVGRWNPKVSKLFQGLVWVGGVHVDPGFTGPLRCPVYNLSQNPIVLRPGETFASIDFEKTTEYSKNESLDYPTGKKPPREHPGSGLEIVRDEVKEFPKRLELFQTTNFAILAIIVAALSVIAVAPQGEIPDVEYAQLYGAASFGAIFMSVAALIVSLIRRR